MTATATELPSNFLSSTLPKHPYPGLRPFEAEEWMIFFGREKMTEDVIARLARQRLVFIHGASGSGKSSLVRAGVLPKLARQYRRHGEEWHTFTMRPSGGPLWNLAEQFAKLEGRSDESTRVDEIARLFDRRGATLASVAGEIGGLAGKQLCILVDQFEELFRFEREISREEAEPFIDLLIGEVDRTIELDPDEFGRPAPGVPVNEHHAKVHIVVTMRSEFLGECTRFGGLAEAINHTQYLVPRMSHEALLRAIQRPAQIYGGEVSTELAERLIADVRGREDEPPLIQHRLMELWKKASEKSKEKIKLDVGLFGKGGSLASLLSNHAEEVMRMVAGTLRTGKAVENLFRALIERTAKKQAIRRPQQFKDLVAVSNIDAQELRAIIEAFRAGGVSFLTPASPTEIKEETTIDISHEALIRCWKKIADENKGWLKRETEDGIRWTLLLVQAREFAADPKRVLYPATRARDAKEWLAKKTKQWCNRYGGERELVEKLIEASLRTSAWVTTASAFGTMTAIGIAIGIVLIIMYIIGVSSEFVTGSGILVYIIWLGSWTCCWYSKAIRLFLQIYFKEDHKSIIFVSSRVPFV